MVTSYMLEGMIAIEKTVCKKILVYYVEGKGSQIRDASCPVVKFYGELNFAQLPQIFFQHHADYYL